MASVNNDVISYSMEDCYSPYKNCEVQGLKKNVDYIYGVDVCM